MMKFQYAIHMLLGLAYALFPHVSIFGQIPTFAIHQEIVVEAGGQPLANAWAGGLNASQFNKMDLNQDGTADLVVFDRTNNKVSTFLAIENNFAYAPQFEAMFPDMRFWLLLRDYNCDGRPDIFTSAPNGIRVYQNITTPDAENLQWQMVKDPVTTLGFSGFEINLKVDVTDIPSITDVDGDGDLDVLNFVPSVGGTVEFHQNFSMERYGTCDSLEFEKITNRWGGFEECGTCNTYLFEESAACRTAKIEHAGSALLALSLDGNDTKELLLGEISCTNLVAFNNVGTSDSAIFEQVQLSYPAENPIDIQVFPAAFYEDVDFDGKPDLLASPNLFFNEGDLVDFEKSNWYYHNSGTTDQPSFELRQKDFLQQHMVDLGEFTSPATADIDGDGDLDLLVANRGKLYQNGDFYATLFLFENIGSTTSPRFTLADPDYLQFSSQNLIELKIGIADLNADSRPDLYYSARERGTSNVMLNYLPNQSANGLSLGQGGAQSINVEIRPRDEPHFVDIDEDGDQDLLLGKFQDGRIAYYENEGGNSFTLRNTNLGGLTGGVGQNELSLETADLTGDGQLDLVMGNWGGKLLILPDFQFFLNQTFEPATDLIYNPLLESNYAHRWGSGIFPVAFGQDLILGTAGGGLFYLKNNGVINSIGDVAPESAPLELYPNPASEKLTISSPVPAFYSIYTLTGQVVMQGQLQVGNGPLEIQTVNWENGIYLLKAVAGQQSFVKKFIIQKQ